MWPHAHSGETQAEVSWAFNTRAADKGFLGVVLACIPPPPKAFSRSVLTMAMKLRWGPRVYPPLQVICEMLNRIFFFLKKKYSAVRGCRHWHGQSPDDEMCIAWFGLISLAHYQPCLQGTTHAIHPISKLHTGNTRKSGSLFNE